MADTADELQQLAEARARNPVGMILDDAIVIVKDLVRQMQDQQRYTDVAALFILLGRAREVPVNLPTLTLAKSMAVAVINDDLAAAHALADMLREDPTRQEMNETAKAFRDQRMATGNEVYHWPEFQALAKRLGILWDHLTIDLTIMIPCRGPVRVIQKHDAVDTQSSIP